MIRIPIDAFPALLKPGMTVYLPGATGEPTAALNALAEQPQRAAGVHFVANFVPGINDFDLLALDEEASLTVFFMQPSLTRYAGTKRLAFVPLPYSEIDGYLRGLPAIDVAVVQVSAADAGGECSLGPCVEFNPTILAKAACRVAIVNQKTPFLSGSVNMALDSFDYVAHVSCAMRTFGTHTPDVISTTIANHIASLIEDHDTLQMGIGKIPSQVMATLVARKGLRVHSGLATGEVRSLIRAGALVDDAPVVCGCFDASEDFYKDTPNPSWLTVRPVSFTHNPATLARIDRLVSINSSIEVDLLGQCNAEVAAGRSVSGPGGLPDFTLAAHRSNGGRSIIALPSTDRSGALSRIVATLSDGAPATLSRGIVDFVVTEHGVASLRAKDIRGRTRALIDIAHPKFREVLARQFHSKPKG